MSVNNFTVYNSEIKKKDLSDGFIEIYNQGDLGSCAINAFCAVFNYELVRALGLAQPNTSISINNCLSMFMLSCIRNGTSTEYKCTVVNKEEKEKYKYIVPFRPSRYYLYYYACTRNNNNIDPNDFKDGGGSHIKLIKDAINLRGILKELPDENNNNWQLEKSFDNPTTNDEKKVKIEDLKEKLINAKSDADKSKINELITKYTNLTFNYTDIYYKETSDVIIEAKKWTNKQIIDIITIKKFNNEFFLDTIRQYLQNFKPILISMNFNLKNKISSQLITILPSNIDVSEYKGHMMVIVGYDDDDHAFKVRNSWGAGWGKGGYCDLSYGFFDQKLSGNYNIELNVLNLNLDNYPKT